MFLLSHIDLFNAPIVRELFMKVKQSTREMLVESALIGAVEAAGGIAEKVTVLGRRGFFDRLIVLPGGRVVFCEVKRPRGGTFSAHQIQRHKVYRALGVEVAIVKNSADIERLLSSRQK
jgi:hypothetical protein